MSPSGDFPFSQGICSGLSSVGWDVTKLKAKHDAKRTSADARHEQAARLLVGRSDWSPPCSAKILIRSVLP